MTENEDLDSSLQMSNTVKLDHKAVKEDAERINIVADVERTKLSGLAANEDSKLLKMKKVIAETEKKVKEEKEKPILVDSETEKQWYFISFVKMEAMHRVNSGYFVFIENKLDAIKNIMQLCAKEGMTASDFNCFELKTILEAQNLILKSL